MQRTFLIIQCYFRDKNFFEASGGIRTHSSDFGRLVPPASRIVQRQFEKCRHF